MEICENLWKSPRNRLPLLAARENRRKALSEAGLCACSACAGDYEDPDLTAGTHDMLEEDDGAVDRNAEDFPTND